MSVLDAVRDMRSGDRASVPWYWHLVRGPGMEWVVARVLFCVALLGIIVMALAPTLYPVTGEPGGSRPPKVPEPVEQLSGSGVVVRPVGPLRGGAP